MTDRVLERDNAQPLRAEFSLRPEIVPGPSATGMDDLHELRVRIPVNLHRQLLSLKVLRGRSLAETVSLALDNYFAQVKTPPPSTQAKPDDKRVER